MPTHFPSAAELEATYNAYEAEMAMRRLHPLPPAPRDQDERPARPMPTVADRVFCPHCGRRFDHAQKQVARMMRGAHIKREHRDQVEAG